MHHAAGQEGARPVRAITRHLESHHIPIEPGRPFDVSDIEDDMPDLFGYAHFDSLLRPGHRARVIRDHAYCFTLWSPPVGKPASGSTRHSGITDSQCANYRVIGNRLPRLPVHHRKIARIIPDRPTHLETFERRADITNPCGPLAWADRLSVHPEFVAHYLYTMPSGPAAVTPIPIAVPVQLANPFRVRGCMPQSPS